MKKYKLISGLIAFVLGTSFTSCEQYLDINANPNYPTTAEMSTLLPSTGASTISQLGLNGVLVGSLWMQYVTQGNTTNQYNTTANYTLTTSSYNGFWSNAYSNTLPDLKLVIQKAEESGAWNYWVIAKIMTAYNFHILTDFYEDIPFTEALNEEFPNPKYDDSKSVVYPGILAMLDEAIAKEAEAKANTNPVITKQDFFFNGKIDKWISFAKTLKLKILMRDYAANKTDIMSLVKSGALLDGDCAMIAFEDATNKGNPFYEYNIRQLNTKENVRACHTFVEFLLAKNDPRIEFFYEMTYDATQEVAAGNALTYAEMYEGLPCGYKPETNIIPLTASSRYLQSYSDPVYLMNKAEVKFMMAEAYARGNEPGKAKTAYDSGVMAAFERYGLDGSGFIAAGGAYEFDASSMETMLHAILIQKWISYAKANSWDAWLDRNRTGIPVISMAHKVRISDKPMERTLEEEYVLGTLVDPGVTALQPREVPRRFMVPNSSAQYNPNAPVTKDLVDPMWWQVR